MSVQPHSLISSALNEIYKAKQSTNGPFKQEIILKSAHLLGPLEQTTIRRLVTESVKGLLVITKCRMQTAEDHRFHNADKDPF